MLHTMYVGTYFNFLVVDFVPAITIPTEPTHFTYLIHICPSLSSAATAAPSITQHHHTLPT